MSTKTVDSYSTIPEIAARLRVCQKTVYDAVRSGRLKAVRFGKGWRIAERDLAAYLNRNVPQQAA